MNATLQAIASVQGGVVLRPQALDAGYNDNDIAVLRKSGEWVAVRRGAYMEAGLWNNLDDAGRHRARVIAVVKQLKVPAVPSHVSAAVMHGFPVWEIDLSLVHVTRTDLHSGRREAGVQHHPAGLDDDELTVIDGIVVTNAARTAFDVARNTRFEPAVVTADAALAILGNNKDALFEMTEGKLDWPGARNAGRVTEFADGRSESVGESRTRVQFERIGLPRPELQVVLVAPDGTEDRVDFRFLEERTISEFDGREKYHRFLRPGENPADVVWREKLREDRIRAQRYAMVRTIWRDLDRDDVVRERHLAAFRQSRNSRTIIA